MSARCSIPSLGDHGPHWHAQHQPHRTSLCRPRAHPRAVARWWCTWHCPKLRALQQGASAVNAGALHAASSTAGATTAEPRACHQHDSGPLLPTANHLPGTHAVPCPHHPLHPSPCHPHSQQPPDTQRSAGVAAPRCECCASVCCSSLQLTSSWRLRWPPRAPWPAACACAWG
jgi:hypothetical protein